MGQFVLDPKVLQRPLETKFGYKMLWGPSRAGELNRLMKMKVLIRDSKRSSTV